MTDPAQANQKPEMLISTETKPSDLSLKDFLENDVELQGLTSIAAVTENRAKEVGIAIYT